MTLLDSALARRSNLFRKAVAYGLQVPRGIARMREKGSGFRHRLPVPVNSMPKSGTGTHLLLQIARALPGTVYYGSFLAWGASWSLKPHSQEWINSRIRRIVPGEVLGGHLHYSQETETALKAIDTLHLFIQRDPRDIALSEADYLAYVNPWHRMHGQFKNVHDEDRRVQMVIEGDAGAGDLYPDLHARLLPYLAWTRRPSALVVRYEDLQSARLLPGL